MGLPLRDTRGRTHAAKSTASEALGVNSGERIIVRDANSADMPGIFRVRTSVGENLLTREQLAERGITEQAVAASLLLNRKGWIAERDGEIVGFSIADRQEGYIFALFVLPGYESRGLGTRLLEAAVEWLRQNGIERIWLTTANDTRASRFYPRRGWVCVGTQPNGELRFELARTKAR